MKVLFTSIFALFLATSAWATGEMPNPANCTESDLGASEGPLNIDLVWEPNTINTTWYSEGVQIQNAPQSCSYSNTMTLPTAPSRPGYAFAGWTLRCNIPSGLGQPPSSYGYMGANNQAYNNVYGLTEPGTWAATWPNGDILYGTSVWAGGSGNTPVVSNNTNENVNCWCGAIGYQPSGGSRCSLGATLWIDLRVASSVGADLEAEGLSLDVGACAQACVASGNGTGGVYGYNGWNSVFGANTPQQPSQCQGPVPSSLFQSSPTNYGYVDNNGQGYNTSQLNGLNLSSSNNIGVWASLYANGDAVGGIAQCIEDSEAESMLNLSSGSLMGPACPSGTGTCSCMCGLAAYKPSGGSTCTLSTTIWMSNASAINTVNADMDAEHEECNIGQCAQFCASDMYGGWQSTFGS